MKFGVFIRSIGERTERLCLEACEQGVSFDKIRLIKDKYPAYEAYKEMFLLAGKFNYDWYLGLDADTILKRDWYQIAMAKIEEVKNKDYFDFSFSVQDKFLRIIDRGNHFYNGKYTEEALRILEEKTKYTLKPESSICAYIEKESPNFTDSVIGFHGYEQYYKHIFYGFWLRRRRGGDLSKQIKLFNDKNKLKQDKDFFVAEKGWNYGRNILSKIGLNRKINPGECVSILKESPKLLEELGIQEKEELMIDLNSFYEFYHS